MLLFEANLVFLRRSCRELYVMNGRRGGGEQKLNGGILVPTCHSTLTALFSEAHVICAYLSCL